MEVGDRARVKPNNRNNTHGAGTIVEVIVKGDPEADPRPYYCQTTEGKTCYWYSDAELEVCGGRDQGH